MAVPIGVDDGEHNITRVTAVKLGRVPKEATMFEQLFTQRSTIAHHHTSPYAAERRLYLSHLIKEGRSRNSLRVIAQLLISYAQHLPLQSTEVRASDIQISAETWAKTRHRSASCLHSGKSEFVFHATKWLRLLGRLYEPQQNHPFAMEREAFLRFQRLERGLAPITIDHYWRSIDELLIWLFREGKTLWDVTPDDIDLHIQRVAKRKLKRTSIAHQVAALRAFFRYAYSRGWCREGVCIIDAPRIYRLESLPRGLPWNDVQHILASCAGDWPTEIRDRAMLMLLAVYGLRSAEVRSLRIDDIDWEREIIRIRRSKQLKTQQYPLVHEVGAAIVRYLREVRPKCKRREVFLTRMQPYRSLSGAALGFRVRFRIRQIGTVLPSTGAHALRHACATHLLSEGLSLKEIADHLGHASLEATQVYTKVDLLALREVGDLPLRSLATFANETERTVTPILIPGSIESLRSVAALSLGGLL
jgi:site-specific recombinase XerD